MKRKTYLILATTIFALIGAVGYFHFSQPQAEEEFRGDFGSENNHYRNTETKNLSPYAIFGDSSFVLMTEAERTGVWEIINVQKGDLIQKVLFYSRTGVVKMLDKQGNTLEEFILPPQAVARFLRPDRFAHKYYDLSPYNYTGNNPINRIDINGDSIWIVHKGQNILYNNGSLYNKDGSAYSGKVKGYLKQTFNALNQLNAVSTGASGLRELEGSQFNFFIQRGTNEFKAKSVARSQLARTNPQMANIAGSGGVVYWDPNMTTGGPNSNGNSTRPSFIGLGHELLGHGLAAKRGMSDYSDLQVGTNTDGSPIIRTRDELFATHMENQLRSEYGLPLRTHYMQGGLQLLHQGKSIHHYSEIQWTEGYRMPDCFDFPLPYNYNLLHPTQVRYSGSNSGW
jgi:hypothetical protein